MHNELKNQLCDACKLLAESGVIPNDAFLSVKDADTGVFALKSTAVALADVTPDNVVIVDENGRAVEGEQQAVSPYFAVHKAVYDSCADVQAVIQPASRWSSIWAQMGQSLAPTSYLHARHFMGEVLCTGPVMLEDGEDLYTITGHNIKNALRNKGLFARGAIFMRNDGALVWGQNPIATANRAVALEELCLRAMMVSAVTQGANSYVAYEVAQQLLEKE